MYSFSVCAVPRLDLESLESGYHGLVKENETLVEVTPQIRALGGKVCSFRIANKHHGEAPFEIILKEKGVAELRALRVLNCEKRRNYKFDIAAVGCSGAQSEKYDSSSAFKSARVPKHVQDYPLSKLFCISKYDHIKHSYFPFTLRTFQFILNQHFRWIIRNTAK